MSNRLELRLIGLITLVNVAVGVVVGGLLYDFAPEHYFKWYPSIPLFYWLMAIAMAFFLNLVKQKKGDVTVTTYMIVRFCKFTLALVFLWLYAAFVGEQLRTFGFTMMLFYFIYLGMETYTLYLYEKKRMNREKREKNELENK
ncbi:hypothetical protein [Parabacteroides sp. AM08-6]|uniref:hypothetical protein n=1 Tax=Parabacteroides sp. AM08-6 TaxID=2292053 RepID=UPI000EFF4DA3|nr:hypothetical protein [Parabacteroides sp. AM08-6]RHJ86613.1 hypothetical protein DW103_02830 [Parabacteroides sp. AM08-6]